LGNITRLRISEILRLTAADEVLFTQLNCSEFECVASFSRWHQQPAQLIVRSTIRIPTDKILYISDYVQTHLQALYQETDQHQVPTPLISDFDYQRMLSAMRDYQQRDLSLVEYIEILEKIKHPACNFERICRLLFEAYLNQYQSNRDKHWLSRAKDLLIVNGHHNKSLFNEVSAVELALAQKNYAKAHTLLEQLEQDHLTDHTILALRARWTFAQGFLLRAQVLMAQLVKQRPSIAHRFNYALILYMSGDNHQALMTLKDITNEYQGLISAYELMADIQLTQGQWQAAIDSYQQIIARSQVTRIATRSNIGLALLMQGSIKQSLKQFKAAAEQAPHNPQMLLNLADAYFLNGDIEHAQIYYRQIISISLNAPSDNKDELMILALAYAHLSNSQQSINTINKLLKHNLHLPFDLYNMATIYVLIGEHETATDYLKQALDAKLTTPWLSHPWFEPIAHLPVFIALSQRND